ncbi:MAG: hypothetical protein IJO85_03005 [Lachnospiraceae bacterium]|nr:hypothetical protein [Lachnospiraceae bacterium]
MMKYYVLTNHIKRNHATDDMLHVTLYIGVQEMSFQLMEEDIAKYWEAYERKIPAETEGMRLEELGDFFFEKLKTMLESKGMELYQVELYDKPTRRYKISDRLLLPCSQDEFMRQEGAKA